ncbi:bacteriocin immunity protein [Pseudomonas fluorescens]|uniref:bacteriocin immunity protein n=1 Tax=Pseudomonas fluorescens TaxID=294 RepID=UPI0019131DEC|nr:bacteriocin immunity protein [Pseudomonas fluorescens]
MELKSTLKEYTASEFQTLINRIREVDLPKKDHDRLINHFDRIVGHPEGADLLFYPDERDSWSSQGSVVNRVRNWHQRQGVAAFKEETVSVPLPTPRKSAIEISLAEMHKLAADVAAAELIVESAAAIFLQAIEHMRSLQVAQMDISGRETSIRTLEAAQHEASTAINKFKFWKMRLEFARKREQDNLIYARSDHAQRQSIAQQINALHDGYLSRLAGINQRHRAQHDEAEILLISAQEKLIHSRALAESNSGRTPSVMQALLDFVDTRPDVLLNGTSPALYLSQRIDMQKAVRSAVAEFMWQHTSGEVSDENQRAAVLSFECSSRADTRIFGISVPLAELQPLEGPDWQLLATHHLEVDLPFRIGTAVVPAKPKTMFQGLREVETLTQIHVSACRGQSLASSVRVRPAQYDEQRRALRFTADGTAPATVCWCAPAVQDSRVPDAPVRSKRLGHIYSSPVPAIEVISGDGQHVEPDDYIVVFPASSGLDPVYVVLSNEHLSPV